MNAKYPSDPLDDLDYLRDKTRRIHEIICTLSDPEVKKELAAHSLLLAQRAESIELIAEDIAVIRMNVERYRSLLTSDIAENNRRILETLLSRAEQALDAPRTLRELAVWYRSFAERAGDLALWEARLRMAEDLDSEAGASNREVVRLDRDHSSEPTTE
jgi:hypothetical protein